MATALQHRAPVYVYFHASGRSEVSASWETMDQWKRMSWSGGWHGFRMYRKLNPVTQAFSRRIPGVGCPPSKEGDGAEGERRMESGEWRGEEGERKRKIGGWRAENGDRRSESGGWRAEE